LEQEFSSKAAWQGTLQLSLLMWNSTGRHKQVIPSFG
jgi:hypothetical protein